MRAVAVEGWVGAWRGGGMVCCSFQDPPVEAAPAESGILQTFHHSLLQAEPKHVVKLQKMRHNCILESRSLITDQ